MDLGLVTVATNIIDHRFEEAPQGSLVLLCNHTVLLDYLSLNGTEAISTRLAAGQYENDINTERSYARKVVGVWGPNPTFVAALRVPIHAASLG